MNWVTERRVVAYSRLVVVTTLTIWLVFTLIGPYTFREPGANAGFDYITYYAVSTLAVDSNAASAYDRQVLNDAERATRSGAGEHAWSYPPTFLLVIFPTSYVPYMLSFFLWGAITTLLYVAVIRALAPVAGVTWVALSFGGWFLSVAQGQNGTLTAAILGGGIVLMESRPVLAGALLGALSYKPHLGLLVPVALLAGRHWLAFLVCGASAVSLAVASLLAFGPDPWEAFARHSGDALNLLEDQRFKLAKMPTVMAAALLLGASVRLAWVLQILSAAGTAVAVGWLWQARVSGRVKASGLCCGALLSTPYAYDYDLAILALAIASLTMDGLNRGLLPWEREALVLAWALPLAVAPIATITSVQIGPFGVAILLGITIRRARRELRSPVTSTIDVEEPESAAPALGSPL